VNQYEVHYISTDHDGGDVPDSLEADYNTEVTLAGNPGGLTKEGHTFVGWNTEPDGTGTLYKEGDKILLGASDVQLYVQWRVNQYEVRYHGNGHDGGTVPPAGHADFGGIVLAADPGSLTKTDHAFDGWNTKPDGSGTAYAPGDPIVLGAEDITLFAQWRTVPPASPLNLSATAGNGQVTLQWNTVTGAVYYNVYTGLEPGLYDASLKASTTETTYNVTGLTNGITYYFAVTAVNTVTESVYSNEVSATPISPVFPPSGSSGSADVETYLIRVVVYGDEGEKLVTNIAMQRTTDPDGFKIDELTLSLNDAEQIAEKLRSFGSGTAIMAIPDRQDDIGEWKIAISSASVKRLADGGVNLEFRFPHASLTIPSTSLQGWQGEPRFRFVPVRQEEDRRDIERRIVSELEQTADMEAGNPGVEMLGRPAIIESNIQGQPVLLVLPLGNTDSAIQPDELLIYVEHDDGTTELIPGELVPYGTSGQSGLRFSVSRFSTFAIVRVEGWGVSGQEESETAPFHHAYIHGYDDGSFRPDKPLTRAEMASIVARLLENMPGAGNGSNAYGGYLDTSGHWAKDAIEKAAAAGIMNGYGDGTFRPDRTLTRAEAVVIINRLLGRGPLYGAELQWSDVPENHWAFPHIQEAAIDHGYRTESDGREIYDAAP
jgi:hypothetical protein